MADLFSDSAPQILDRMIRRCLEISQASGGVALDFSGAQTVGRALYEPIALDLYELQQTANLLPLKSIDEILAIASVPKDDGKYAKVTLQITLNGRYALDFNLFAGTYIGTGNFLFALDADFRIPASTSATSPISGAVSATSIQPGTSSNGIAKNSSWAVMGEVIPQIASVLNIETSAGGTEPEAAEAYRSRVLETLNKPELLISTTDFEREARSVLGVGAVALALEATNALLAREAGNVHLFVLNPDGSQPNEAQRANVRDTLSRQAALGRDFVHCSAIVVKNLRVTIIAEIQSGVNPTVAAKGISDRLSEYFKAGRLPVGEVILVLNVLTEVWAGGGDDAQLRAVFKTVRSVAIGEMIGSNAVLAQDFALAKYAIAKLKQLEITLAQGSTSYPYTFIY